MPRVWIDPVYCDEAVATGEYDRVFIIVWRGDPTMPRLDLTHASFDAIARRLEGKLSMLAVIGPESSPPSLAGIRASARHFDRHVDRFAASAAVLEERGATRVIRDAVAAVNALRRGRAVSKFCADVQEAVTWLAARHPHAGGDAAFRAGLLDAAERVRSRLPG